MDKRITVAAIVALGNQRQIGKGNELLWNIPEDLKRFKWLTTEKAVIMGRKTWESLPESVRPLPDRENIVLTRNKTYRAAGATVKHSVDDALHYAKNWSQKNAQSELMVIGGETVYTQTIEQTDRLYVTHVDSDTDGDAFFPPYKDSFGIINQEQPAGREGAVGYTFIDLERS